MADQLKAGWTDAGGGMVKNAQGQLTYIGSDQYNAGSPAAQGQTEQGGGLQPSGQGSNPYDPASTATATQATASQQDQGTLRNALISQMTQSAVPDANDPAIAAQINPYRAAVERAQGANVRNGAEQAFAKGQDFGAPEQAMAAERAGQQSGLMESQLVGREIQSRREQIQQAMQQFGNMLSGDQMRALQKQLADLDAQTKREGLNVQSTLGQGDLSLRRDMGTGGLSNQLLGILLGNQQGNDQMGLQAAMGQAGFNRDALLSLFG